MTRLAFTAWGGDKIGSRKIPLVIGSILAIFGTVLFCVARAPEILVCARLLQGFSNGAVYSAGLPLIADTVKASEVGSWSVVPTAFHSSRLR